MCHGAYRASHITLYHHAPPRASTYLAESTRGVPIVNGVPHPPREAVHIETRIVGTDATLWFMEVRTLQKGEWPLWRQLRFDALSDSPDAFRPTLEEEQDQSDEWWIDIIETTIEHPRGGLWIAEVDSVPVGMLFARIDTDHAVVEVGAMWVHPSVRGRGVGSGLLSAALEWARSRGVRHAELWVTESNSAAMGLYERYGFETTTDNQPLRSGSDSTVRKMESAIWFHPEHRDAG